MTLLVGVPVILSPLAGVVESWNYRPHFLVVNGCALEWNEVITRDYLPFPKVDAMTADRGRVPNENRGVPASWNLIFRYAQAHDFSHVALVSQNIAIDGGTARLAQVVAEHGDWRGLHTDFAWRCIVLSVAVWEQVGPFDEQFGPGYFEDSDYVRRLALAGLHTQENPLPYAGPRITGRVLAEARTLRSGVIERSCYGRNSDRYLRKWGGPPFQETFTVPYGG